MVISGISVWKCFQELSSCYSILFVGTMLGSYALRGKMRDTVEFFFPTQYGCGRFERLKEPHCVLHVTEVWITHTLLRRVAVTAAFHSKYIQLVSNYFNGCQLLTRFESCVPPLLQMKWLNVSVKQAQCFFLCTSGALQLTMNPTKICKLSGLHRLSTSETGRLSGGNSRMYHSRLRLWRRPAQLS